MKMNTENVDIELFINLVRSYPYIYDKGNKMYKDIKRKENTWLKIGETVNLPHDVCQKYFVSLREKYMGKRKKQRNLKSGSGMCNKPKWAWFDDMSFLDEHIQERRPTYSNVKVSNNNINNSGPIEEAEENNDLQHLFDNDEFRYDQGIEFVNIESEDNEISPVITQTPVWPTKKIKTTTSSTR